LRRAAGLADATGDRAAGLAPATTGRAAGLRPVTRDRAARLRPAVTGRAAGLDPVSGEDEVGLAPAASGRAAGLDPVSGEGETGLAPVTRDRAAALPPATSGRAAGLRSLSAGDRAPVLVFPDGRLTPFAAPADAPVEDVPGSVRDVLAGHEREGFYLAPGPSGEPPAGFPASVAEGVPAAWPEEVARGGFPLLEASRALRRGDGLAAAVAAREALRRQPAAPAPWFALAEAHLLLADAPGAEECVRRGLALSPTWPLEGPVLAAPAEGDRRRAVEDAVERGDASALLLAWIGLGAGDSDSADAALRRALADDPDDTAARALFSAVRARNP
jgi:hypothetical protein